MADRSALRRYPALAFLGAAGLLALLLPSSLRLPLSGPPSVAELAPVPSKDAADANGDLSALGQAGSGGLGAGNGAGGAGAPTTTPGRLPSQARPKGKRCVGNPPRQTEDPLSPPCVSFFEGDNGGATTRGVTKDEIRVILQWTAANPPRFVDYDQPAAGSEQAQDVAARAYARYFNDRYQTYGRRLHLFGYYGHGLSAEQVRADVVDLSGRNPFAVVPLDTLTSVSVSQEASRQGLTVVGYRGLPHAAYEDVAPRLVTWAPDLDDVALQAASFLCGKLSGRPARFSGDVADLQKRRVFGLLYTTSNDEPFPKQLAALLQQQVPRTCGERLVEAAVGGDASNSYREYPAALANLRTQGVTTIVVVTKAGDVLTYLPAAAAMGWHPEWFFPQQPGSGGDDTNSAQVYAQDEWAHAFGVSFDYRRGPLVQQPWVSAFKEACPDCAVPASYLVGRAYDTLALLAYGIQAAGPKLTPAAMDKGLHAIPRRPSEDPYLPAFYFETRNWSFVKDAKAMWWDPTGKLPDARATGCYRLARQGTRSRADWLPGDDDLFTADAPCQGLHQY